MTILASPPATAGWGGYGAGTQPEGPPGPPEAPLSPEAIVIPIARILSWPCGVLFAGFVLIVLFWELSTSFLAFITVYFSGRRAIWLQRLKARIPLS